MAQDMNFNNNTSNNCNFNITQQIKSAEQIADPPTSFGIRDLGDTVVGRDGDVEVLLSLVKDHHKVLITGIGGLGKTTLANLCANRWVNDEDFKHAVLINAETDLSVKNDFQALAKKIFRTTDKSSTEIYEHYNKLEVKTIFVLDNIETRDTNYNINKYLPHENLTNIFVLGTSQYTELRRIFYVYTLDKLSIVSSVDMVCKILSSNKEPIDIDETETKVITDLAEKLDYHPLALEHAAAYIVDCTLYNGMSVLANVEQYIKTLSERLAEEPPYEHPTEYRKPVRTALEMNIAKATSECEDARKLLFCISYLDPTCIDIAMFYKHPAFNRERIKMAIRELKKYSIISQNDDYIRLHRLIQTVYRTLIEKENTQNNYMVDLLNVLFSFGNIWYSYIRHHCSYLIQNLNIDKQAMSSSYITAFHSNDEIIESLTARLRLINCNMEDIKNWSARHCSVFAEHETFYKYFNASEHGSGDDRPERYASDTLTVYHVAIIRSSDMYLFNWMEDEIKLISFIERNENQKNKIIIKGLTTLNLCAAFNVNANHCSKLIKIGCDVNIPDDSGMTPILYAARNAAYELVFTLHRAGATYDQSYKELLSAASNYNHESVLALLRASGIDCTASDFSKTVLQWAADKRYWDLVLELIGRHTDVNVANGNGDTPLLLATCEGHKEIVAALLNRGAKTEVAASDGDTPLLVAASRGHSKIVAALLDGGANTEVTDSTGFTPLMLAAMLGHSKIVAALLDHGAKTEVAYRDGETPLLLAAMWGHSEIVAALLDHGANTEVTDNIGYTPLLRAASDGHSEIVAALLNHGANTEVTDIISLTPLMWAVMRGHSEIVAALLDRGANIDAKSKWGDTALSIAVSNGYSTIVELLNEHRARSGGAPS